MGRALVSYEDDELGVNAVGAWGWNEDAALVGLAAHMSKDTLGADTCQPPYGHCCPGANCVSLMGQARTMSCLFCWRESACRVSSFSFPAELRTFTFFFSLVVLSICG